MKTLCPLVTALALTGCETVEMQYTEPAKHGAFDAIEAQANEHYEYFVFPKTYILVTPVDETGKDKPAQEHATTADQDDKNKQSAAAGKVKPKANDKTDKKKNEPAPPTNNASASPSLSNGLATALIDGRKWEAKVLQLPDEGRAMAVRGVSGFWKSTAVGITKYQNTDLVSSISTKAENLFPKRLGQIASVVATAVQIGAVIGVSGGSNAEAMDLEPFVAEVPKPSGRINNDWTYSFRYDNPTPPSGTVTFQDFKDRAMNHKVPYWPVPACRSATLVISRESDDSESVFHVTVSSADILRLQPLSIDGKVELGSVCSATVSGATAADGFTTLSDDFQAVKQAIETIKNAKKPSSGGNEAGATGQ